VSFAALAFTALLGGPGPGVFAEAARVEAGGGVVVEARLVYYQDMLTGVSFHVTSPAGAPAHITVESLELAPPVPVVITGLWFHDVSGRDYVEVRKDGAGPLAFTAPPSSTLEVMLTFAPVRESVYARRVTLRVNGERVVVAGRVSSISFSPETIDGRLP
jgi:hypothetical protein